MYTVIFTATSADNLTVFHDSVYKVLDPPKVKGWQKFAVLIEINDMVHTEIFCVKGHWMVHSHSRASYVAHSEHLRTVLSPLAVFLSQNLDSVNRIQHFDAVCTVHHSTLCIWTNKMHKILVIRLYFVLDALNVSDCISPSSGATL